VMPHITRGKIDELITDIISDRGDGA